MIKEILKEKEPIAYTSLRNDLRTGKIAHSYLFSGELNPLKVEAAYLMAQSIIEGSGDFADEESETSKRIRRNGHFDVFYIDGYKSSIKVNDMEEMMKEFEKTSLEESGKKIYIISNINNSSTKVLNMILKFIEEPKSENNYGIFITDRKEDLLETIVSRCQNVPFNTRDFSFLIRDYENSGFEYTDAYLLSDYYHEFRADMDLNDEKYLLAKESVYRMIDLFDKDRYDIEAMLYGEYFSSFPKKEDFNESADYFLGIMIRMIIDAFEERHIDDEYDRYLVKIRNFRPEELLDIFMEAKEKTMVSVDRKLLFDSIAYQIISL